MNRKAEMYISRKECPSCGKVEYKHILRNTQTKTCKCGTKMEAEDVAWMYNNPDTTEFYKGNQWSNFMDCQIQSIWKLDSRYADEIMTLFPIDDQENICYSKYEII
tara:strand:+ start:960 stop:1277 length:318 start_codon:yes stop_codon:yes gene_type:complete